MNESIAGQPPRIVATKAKIKEIEIAEALYRETKSAASERLMRRSVLLPLGRRAAHRRRKLGAFVLATARQASATGERLLRA